MFIPWSQGSVNKEKVRVQLGGNNDWSVLHTVPFSGSLTDTSLVRGHTQVKKKFVPLHARNSPELGFEYSPSSLQSRHAIYGLIMFCPEQTMITDSKSVLFNKASAVAQCCCYLLCSRERCIGVGLSRMGLGEYMRKMTVIDTLFPITRIGLDRLWLNGPVNRSTARTGKRWQKAGG